MTQTSEKVGEYTDYTIRLKLTHNIPAKGKMYVIVPIGTNDKDMKFSDVFAMDVQIHGGGDNTNVVLSSKQSTKTQNSYYVENSNGFFNTQIDVNGNSYIQMRMRTIRNPIWLGTSETSMTIQTMNSDLKVIDEISSGLGGVSSIAASITFTSLEMTSKVVGEAIDTVKLKIQPASAFQDGGKLVIDFPVGFTFGTVTCKIIFGLTSDLSGGGSCSVVGQ